MSTDGDFAVFNSNVSQNLKHKGRYFVQIANVMRVCPDCGCRMKMRRVVYPEGSIWYCRRNHRYETTGDKTPILEMRHQARIRKETPTDENRHETRA